MRLRNATIPPEQEERIRQFSCFRQPRDSLEEPFRTASVGASQWPPPSGWEMLRVLWSAYFKEGGVWQGIDLSDAKIVVFAQDTVLSEEQLKSRFAEASQVSLGHLRQSTHFTYRLSEAPEKYALAYFVAENQADSPPWPRILVLHWNTQLNNWTIQHTGALYSGKRTLRTNLLM